MLILKFAWGLMIRMSAERKFHLKNPTFQFSQKNAAAAILSSSKMQLHYNLIRQPGRKRAWVRIRPEH